eukprot:Skav215038  [mRNA]  locus=scaffold4007:2472:11212:+ [translate_table: standard]
MIIQAGAVDQDELSPMTPAITIVQPAEHESTSQPPSEQLNKAKETSQDQWELIEGLIRTEKFNQQEKRIAELEKALAASPPTEPVQPPVQPPVKLETAPEVRKPVDGNGRGGFLLGI